MFTCISATFDGPGLTKKQAMNFAVLQFMNWKKSQSNEVVIDSIGTSFTECDCNSSPTGKQFNCLLKVSGFECI